MKKIFPQMDLPYDKDFYQDYGIFIKPIDYALSTKKIESLLAIAEMQKYFQCNPVQWIDLMYNIELLDYQALMIQKSWFCPHVIFVCSRGAGKSTIIDLELMAKDSLFCNYWCYIASGTGDQAQQTFTVLEKLANDNIDTFAGSTGKLFKDELKIKAANTDGFSHNPSGFTYELYNGSQTITLNSSVDARRGGRGSVIFDEAGFLGENMVKVYSAFAIVNKSLRTGKDSSGKSIDPIRQRTFATDIPNQLFYISSASSKDTPFYATYKEYSKQQIMGNPEYCALHIDCEICFKPTLRGELVAPLLSRETVRSEMRQNVLKSRREYYCLFDSEGGENAILKRATIIRNEEVRKPILENPDNKRKFGLFYDPARKKDNSFVLVAEFIEEKLADGSIDIKAKLCNGINMMDVGRKLKSPMRTPEQVDYLRKIILAYNGGVDSYGNIVGVWIDAGSGGAGGTAITDLLMQDWVDDAGIVHRGLIDREYSADYIKDFPNAVNKLHLMEPSKYKSIMYEAMIEMVNLDKISFTASYDGKGYLTVFDIDEDKLANERKKIEGSLKKEHLSADELSKRVNEKLANTSTVKTKMVKLDWQEELALKQIDALKEEVVNMVRKKRDSGRDSFDLAPEKARILNDDRSYTLALCGYALSEERRKQLFKKPKQQPKDLVDKLAAHIKKPIRRR